MRRPPAVLDRPPTIEIMRKLGLEPDPWQLEVLTSEHRQVLLNCCRQAGKSTVVALMGLVEAMFKPMTRIVIVSRSHRQSRELLKTMAFFYRLLGERLKAKVNAQEIELANLSRIVCVPCREDTISARSRFVLRRHLPVAGRFEPGLFERQDEPLFPPSALREALVNALIHRDYSIPGGGAGCPVAARSPENDTK